jgi:polysaccharide chain length determinant protein (PEP-CTERM system associated)
MHEILEQLQEQFRSAWRYRWWALITAWVVAALGWLIVFSIPSQYSASARVYIDASSRLGPLLQGLAVDRDIDAQLNLVRQALLSRPQLLKVAQQTDLDLNVRDDEKARERLVEGLRREIRIELDRGATNADGRPQSRDRLYTIYYENHSPQKALAVVQTLLNTFVEDTLGGNRTGSETAQTFLRQQIAEIEKRLAESEAALADFKKKNVGLMPRESGDFFGRMQAEIDAIQRAQSQLRSLAGQRDAVLSQLRGQTAVLASAGAARGPNGQLMQNDIDSRLQDAEARLGDALLKYTDKHPEVVALRQTIEELQKRRKEELAALRRGEAGSGGLSVASNPVYQNLQIKLNDLEVQMAASRGEVADRQRRIDEFRKMMNVAPDVEAELARLNRDYGVTKAQYDALVDRLERARLSNQAEETGVIRFEVIDPPVAKFDPVSPNRPLLVALVFLAALAAGVAVAWLMSQFQRTIVSARSLATLTGRPVAGAITAIVDDTTRLAEQTSLRRLATAGGVLVALFAVVLFFPAGLLSRLTS